MNVTSSITRTATMLFLAMFCALATLAEERTAEQAMEQALQFLTGGDTPSGSRPRRARGTTPQLMLQGRVSGLYVFNVEDDGGFIIVSNDDRTLPILGFSESGNFKPEEMPDNMKAWLQGYADEIAWLQKQTSPKANASRPRNKVGSHSTAAVAPLCTSTWNQDAPYNNLCPTYNDGWSGSGKCATGCVATAMAQVMYYHKWPAKSTKVIPAYTTSSYNMSMASLPITSFNWNSMKDSYSGSYTSAQATAVATLMKYCGYSVKMDYGPSSGAYTEDVAVALREYFDYSPSTTRFVSRSSFTYANWTDMIYHEVSHGRPVCYGGLSDGGGHEFVCDGYKFESNTDFFHINWGWGGLSDNYFVLSALDPDQQGIGGSTSTDGFHYGQDAVIGIQKSTDTGTLADIPANVVDLTMNSMTLSRNPVEPYTMVNITCNVTNNSGDPYDGDLYLAQRMTDDDYMIELESVVIPAGATQDIVISYTPTEAGSYTFVPYYINSEGAFTAFEGTTVTLTVAESLTNDVVPVYGYWTDNYSRSQFIIGDADLEDMVGGEINAMTFTASQENVSWGAAKFDVYLKEVEESTISSLKAWDTLDKVYSGSLSIVNNEMTITFSEPYYYQGGNLLVGINQTATGTYSKSSWYGQTVTGASMGGYGSSISQQNFLPDVVFDFTPGTGIHVSRPKNLAVSYNGGDQATVTWTSDAPAFDIEVNGTVTENVDNPCLLTDLELATTYIIKVRAKNEDVVSDWTEPVSFTTDLSYETCQIRLELTDLFGDGWGGSAIKVVDVLTGTVLGTFANTDAAKKNEVQVYTAEVPDGRDIEFQWVKGSYDHECVYAVYDVRGGEIFSGKGRMAEPVAHHVRCSLPATAVTLAGNSDNTALIESLHGTENCDVTLEGRTLYQDGTWNTLCLPFALALDGSPLEGADIRTLTGIAQQGETVTMLFTQEGTVTEIEAGRPYIIRWDGGENLVNPIFSGVTIDKTMRDIVCTVTDDATEAGSASVTFKGTYRRIGFTETDKSILFVGATNRLNYPLAGAVIGPQRAFFQLEGFEASPNPSQGGGNGAKTFVLNLEEDDPTSINEELRDMDEGPEWFDLQGRKLAGKPSRKGTYIRNGKKIAVR